MSSLDSGAGIARLTGIILTAVALCLAATTAAILPGLPAVPTGDDWIMLAVLAALTVVLLGAGLPLLVGGARILARQRRILRTGVPCLATIHRITGLENPDPDERHVSRIDLAIPAPTGPVTAVVRHVVPLHLARRLGPGVQIPVRVDPADPAFAVVDWTSFERRTSIAGAVAGSAVLDVALGLLT